MCVDDTLCNLIGCQTGYCGSMGDSNTCFDIGYNDVYSPWSNPPLSVYNQNDSLTIEIAGKNSSGNLLVNVYFTNITAAKPSKPQGLKVSQLFGENANAFNPKLIWYKNHEPDVISNGYYKIYRGAIYSTTQEPTYSYLATVSSNDTEYVDYQTTLYTGMLGGVNCGNNLITFSYKVTAVDNTNLESVKSDRDYVSGYMDACLVTPPQDKLNSNSVKEFKLKNNYPNPFNPETKIEYELPKDVFVTIKIYDLLGREIKTLVNEYKNAGSHIVSFNGSEFASGIYFYRIQAENYIQVRRMVLIK
jgi:hypothetical protein